MNRVAIFVLALFAIQALEGTALYFSFGCAVFILIAAFAHHRIGGPPQPGRPAPHRRIARNARLSRLLPERPPLCGFATLRAEDTDPRNLDAGRPYINNFVFISAAQPATIDRVRAHLADTPTPA
jgi:hypothetical protein